MTGQPTQSGDVVLASAILVAEGLAEPTKEGEPGGFRITEKGYTKGYKLWMDMIPEDRLLIALFLRKSTLI